MAINIPDPPTDGSSGSLTIPDPPSRASRISIPDPPASKPIQAVSAKPKNLLEQGEQAVTGWLNQQSRESAQSRRRAAAITDPFLPEKTLLAPVVGAAGNLLGTLDRGRQAVEAGVSGHPQRILPALGGSLSSAQDEEDNNTIFNALDNFVNPTHQRVPQNRIQQKLAPFVNPIANRAAHEAIKIGLDPLTYLGGSGLLESGYRQVAKHALPKAIDIAHRIGQLAPEGSRTRGILNDTGHVLSEAYSKAVPGGAMKYGLAQDFGTKADTLANRMFSAKNSGRAQMHAMQTAFSNELHGALKGIKPEDESLIYQALHTGTENELPAALQPAAKRLSNLTDSLAYLSGDRTLRAHLLKEGFQLPDYAKPFDRGIRSLQKKSQYRKNYVPTQKDEYFNASPEERSFLGGLTRHESAPDEDIIEGEYLPPSSGETRTYFGDEADRIMHSASEQARSGDFESMVPEEPFTNSPKKKVSFEPVEYGEPRGVKSKYAKGYVKPGPDKAMELRPDEMARKSKIDLTSDKDKNLQRRAEEGLLAEDPAEQRRIFENRLHGGARAIAGRDTGRRAAHLFNQVAPEYSVNLGPGKMQNVSAKAGSFEKLPQYVRDFFTDKFKADKDKNAVDKLGQAMRATNNAGKAAWFSLPFRHMANIASLGLLHNPSIQGAVDTAKTFASIVSANPEERYKKLKDAIDAGAVGVPSVDRVKPLAKSMGNSIAKNRAQRIADAIVRSPIVQGTIKGVKKWYSMSGNILWSFDDASKATAFRHLVAKGMHPADAAAETNAALIDYSNKSEFTKLLQNFAPFATYRSKMPGAVLRSVAQHPERALTVQRTAPTLAGGEQQAPNNNGNPQVGKSYLPLAETMRMFDGSHAFGVIPDDYTRSTLGWLPRAALSSVGYEDSNNYPGYMTYGKQLRNLGDYAKYTTDNVGGTIPGAQPVLDALSLSQFSDRGLPGAISGQTGLGIAAPAPSELAIAMYMKKHPKATRAQAINYVHWHPGGM